MYKFKKLQDSQREIWEEKNLKFNGTFLSSIYWLDFKESYGEEIQKYLVLDSKDQVKALLNIEISKRKIAKYANLAYGPVIDPQTVSDSVFWMELAKFGHEFIKINNLNYFRIDPKIDFSNRSEIQKTGWKNTFSIGQAKDTWIMDLNDHPSKLLKKQKKDTRYYIRRGEKKGIRVRKANSEKDIQIFIDLTKETKERQNFSNFNSSYYLNQWKFLKSKKESENMIDIWIAEIDGKPLAAALMNYYNGWVNYSHGASTSNPDLAKLAAPYFLHWKIIEDAVDRGFEKYNFWGVIPKGIEHYGRGFSTFKMKFDGELNKFTGPMVVSKNSLSNVLNTAYDFWIYRNERY